MVEITLQWHNARRERPKESGMYLCCIISAQHIANLSYSVIHDGFNVYDGPDQENPKENEIKVDYWADAAPVVELLKRKEKTNENKEGDFN